MLAGVIQKWASPSTPVEPAAWPSAPFTPGADAGQALTMFNQLTKLLLLIPLGGEGER